MKEYIKLYWAHHAELERDEPVVILYEVDLQEDRFATRLIDIYADGHTQQAEDKNWRFVTECPVCTVAEIQSGAYGEEFHACLSTAAEFEETWHTQRYHGALDYDDSGSRSR